MGGDYIRLVRGILVRGLHNRKMLGARSDNRSVLRRWVQILGGFLHMMLLGVIEARASLRVENFPGL